MTASPTPPPQHALDYLFSLELFGMKLGLENMQRLVEALGHPERAYRTVHVAGTNGKGSVTAMVETALHAAGYRAARYTSPHLIDLNERFVVCGSPIETDLIETVITAVRDTVDWLLTSGSLHAQPTFFEVTTAVAFELFRRLEVEIAVCEVGLGGRLDATNVVAPAVTAITTIALDHREQLGDTVDLVAREKAGIIKTGVPLVAGRIDAGPADVIAAIAREHDAPAVWAFDNVSLRRQGRTTDGRPRFLLRTSRRDYGSITLGLAGDHQVDNAVVAVRVLETLADQGVPMPAEAIKAGLERVEWPARLEGRRLPDGREVLFDAAHNPQGADALATYLASEAGDARVLVFGAMRDKDVETMLRSLLPVVTGVVMAQAPGARAATASALADLARRVSPGTPVLVADSGDAALTLAWTLAPRAVVAGSIFLIGDILRQRRGTW